MPIRPALLTFDVFGTVLDWRGGLRASLATRGHTLCAGDFDRVVDRQGALEQESPGAPYREVVARSLVEVLGVPGPDAEAIGREVGTWPLFPDARPALRRLLARAPCGALTNSDRDHGRDVQGQLGQRLPLWLCAEELGFYKPDPRVCHAAAARTGVPMGPAWWHVSAYADYDLAVARSLGLTTVFVGRAHARPGAADLRVPDLLALADVVDALWPREPAWG